MVFGLDAFTHASVVSYWVSWGLVGLEAPQLGWLVSSLHFLTLQQTSLDLSTCWKKGPKTANKPRKVPWVLRSGEGHHCFSCILLAKTSPKASNLQRLEKYTPRLCRKSFKATLQRTWCKKTWRFCPFQKSTTLLGPCHLWIW